MTLKAADRSLPENVTVYLERMGLRERKARVVPLTGDASDRRYFRRHRRGRLVDRARPACGALRLRRRCRSSTSRALLGEMPLPVPAILGPRGRPRVCWRCEDLGDVTLQAHLGRGAGASTRRSTGRRSRSSTTAAAAGRASWPRIGTCPTAIAFDVEKLTWELEFFVKHFLEAYRGAPTWRRPRARRCGEEWRTIVEELAAEPRVLCHRDYHSRNLMLHDGRLYIIDFQDARMGPDTYDLVSLLRDSYVDLTERDGRRAHRATSSRSSAHWRRDAAARRRTRTTSGGGST